MTLNENNITFLFVIFDCFILLVGLFKVLPFLY
jgi:hypothetical protein